MHQIVQIEVGRIFTPAPAPDVSHANIPANTTPAGPPGPQSPNNEPEHSVSAETFKENREHNIVKQKPKPRSLYQQPLKFPSEPTLSTRNPEWELSRERLAAQLVRLRAPPRASCHSFVLDQDDLSIRSIPAVGMYDGHDMPLAGPSLAVGTIHMPCNGGNACDNLPHYRQHKRNSKASSIATIPGQEAKVHAPAPVVPRRRIADNGQDHRISSKALEAVAGHRREDTGVASEIAEAPVLRSPHDSGRSTRWDQNIKQNRFYHWLWLVLPDLGLLFFLFIAVICMEKYLHNFRWMTRTFPMTWDPRTRTWVGPIEISWPKEEFISPILTTEILIPLIPTIILLAMQIWLRSFWDFNAAFFGLFKGIAIVTLLQVILKLFIGKFRPHFMSVCNPEGKLFEFTESAPSSPAIRFASVSECPVIKSAIKSSINRAPPGSNHGPNATLAFERTADYKTLRFAMQSFPSGHTIEAFCVGVFLSLYLNAKLKACSDYHTSFWKLMVVLSPIVGAMFIAASVAVDHNHHFHDVVLSIPIGVLVGLLAYRSHYVSIFNYHTNHLYLPWSSLHRSANLTAPTLPKAGDAKRGYRFGSKFRNKTAVAWPRRPKTQSWDEGQETGIVGLDGTGNAKPGRSKRSRLPGMVRKGRMRQSMFPIRRVQSTDAVRSCDCVSPMTEGPHLMTTATRAAEYSTPKGPPNFAATSHDIGFPGREVAPAISPNTRTAERVAVDDWFYGGRPSDMV